MKVVVKVFVTQSCLTLGDPPGFSVCGILQSRILEWVAIPVSSGSSHPRDQTPISCIAGRFFTIEATRECKLYFLLLKKSPVETWHRNHTPSVFFLPK